MLSVTSSAYMLAAHGAAQESHWSPLILRRQPLGHMELHHSVILLLLGQRVDLLVDLLLIVAITSETR